MKKERRGKPLDTSIKNRIIDSLFNNKNAAEIAEDEGVAYSTVHKIKQTFPLFFGLNRAYKDGS